MIKMTFDQWVANYKPRPNHLADGTGTDFGEGSYIYETSGSQIDYVKTLFEQDPCCIWTLAEADDLLVITEGFHAAAPIGYLITEKPYHPSQHYVIDYSELERDHVNVCVESHDGLTTEQREELNFFLHNALVGFANAMDDRDVFVELSKTEDHIVHIARISGPNGCRLFVHHSQLGLRRQLFVYVKEHWTTLEGHCDETIPMPDNPDEAIVLYFETSKKTRWHEYLEEHEVTVGT